MCPIWLSEVQIFETWLCVYITLGSDMLGLKACILPLTGARS